MTEQPEHMRLLEDAESCDKKAAHFESEAVYYRGMARRFRERAATLGVFSNPEILAEK